MSTTRILWMIACVCLASTGCAMATEADEPHRRIEDAKDEHPLAEPVHELLAEAQLEDVLSRMDHWGEENPSLGASQMVRFELRVKGALTDAAAALRRHVDPGHSPVGSMRGVSHVCAGDHSFWVCCDPWTCAGSAESAEK